MYAFSLLFYNKLCRSIVDLEETSIFNLNRIIAVCIHPCIYNGISYTDTLLNMFITIAPTAVPSSDIIAIRGLS